MREKVGLLCSLRVMLSSGAGPFLDGFSTASAAFLISLIEGITPLETAFFTSLYLAGSFIGAAIFGSIADHVGRRPPFLVAMAVVCALTVLAATFPIIGLLLWASVWEATTPSVKPWCLKRCRPSAATQRSPS